MTELPPIRTLLEAHGLWANKKFGQHFLLDPQLLDRIAGYAGELTDHHVVEVGPGPGGLTRALLARGAKVTAIEKDERFKPLLEPLMQAYPGKFEVIFGDALKVDLTQLHKPTMNASTKEHPPAGGEQENTPPLAGGIGGVASTVASDGLQSKTSINTGPHPNPLPEGEGIKIIANLPYNVGTQMLMNWVTQMAECGAEAFERLTLMFQKEVAQRVVAQPDSKAYGRLAVICQYVCDVEWHQDLAAGAFTPPPKVASAVISLVPKPVHTKTKHSLPPARGRVREGGYMNPMDVDFATLEKVVATAFNQRRKMLRQALKPLGNAEALLEAAGIDGTKRAENLSVEEFCKLVNPSLASGGGNGA